MALHASRLSISTYFSTLFRNTLRPSMVFFPKTQNTAPRPQMVCYFKIQQMTCSKWQTAYIGGLFYKHPHNHIPATPPTARDTNTKHQAATRDRRCSAAQRRSCAAAAAAAAGQQRGFVQSVRRPLISSSSFLAHLLAKALPSRFLRTWVELYRPAIASKYKKKRPGLIW